MLSVVTRTSHGEYVTNKKPVVLYNSTKRAAKKSLYHDHYGVNVLGLTFRAAPYFSLFGEGMWAYRLRSTTYLALNATKANSAAVRRTTTTAADTVNASMISCLRVDYSIGYSHGHLRVGFRLAGTLCASDSCRAANR